MSAKGVNKQTESPPEPAAAASRDAAYWAKQVSKLTVGDVPAEAISRNVEGKRVVGPIQGFGRMWQKTFKVRLGGADVSPQDVVSAWKRQFASFWPEQNFFYGPLTGIAPGEVAVLNLAMPGRVKLSTGVLVLYADDESFAFMTPQGHMLAGWITFSAHEEDGVTVAQVQELIRAQDPATEVAFMLGAHKKQNEFWKHTLRSVARHFGVDDAEVEMRTACVDRRRQWRRTGNVWHSAAIRSGLYTMRGPMRAVRRRKASV
jgi:hypothetical protein